MAAALAAQLELRLRGAPQAARRRLSSLRGAAAGPAAPCRIREPPSSRAVPQPGRAWCPSSGSGAAPTSAGAATVDGSPKAHPVLEAQLTSFRRASSAPEPRPSASTETAIPGQRLPPAGRHTGRRRARYRPHPRRRGPAMVLPRSPGKSRTCCLSSATASAAAPAHARPGVNAPPAGPGSPRSGLTAACRVLAAADSVIQAATEIGWLISEPRPGGSAVSPSTVGDWGRTTSSVLHSVHAGRHGGPRMRPTDQLRYRTGIHPGRSRARDRERRSGPARCGADHPPCSGRPWPPGSAGRTATAVTAVRPRPVPQHSSSTKHAPGPWPTPPDCFRLIDQPSLHLQDLATAPGHPGAMARRGVRPGTARRAYLDEHAIPIDYQRRFGSSTSPHCCPELNGSAYGTRPACPAIPRSTPRPPGAWSSRRSAAARRRPARSSPDPARAGGPGEELHGRPWSSRPAWPAASANQQPLSLARQHVTGEPVNWEPPVTLLDGLSLPGTDPGAIDLGHLHQLVRRDHLGPVAAARRLGTTRAVIDLLLDHDPAPEAAPPRAATRLRKVPSREEFTAYCHGENLSLAEIAKRTGISAGYASQLARDYGVPVRGLKDYSVSEHPVLTRDVGSPTGTSPAASACAPSPPRQEMSKSAVKRRVKIYRLPAPENTFPHSHGHRGGCGPPHRRSCARRLPVPAHGSGSGASPQPAAIHH